MLDLITAVVLSSALHVDRSLDASLPCAANAALEQAVRVRLPRVKLGRGRPVPGDLTARVSATEGGFRFEVHRADGSVAMRRDLFSGCAQLGDTAALILERYLEHIAFTPAPLARERVGPRGGPEDAGTPEPPPKPTEAEAPEPPADAGTPVEPPAPEPDDASSLIARIGSTPAAVPPPLTPAVSPTREEGAWFELSAAGGPSYGDQLVGALALELGVVLRERLRLGLLALARTPSTRVVADTGGPPRGSLEAFDAGAFALLGACTRGALSLCGHAFGGARVTWAAASTDPDARARLFRTTTGAVAVPELGLLARLQLLLVRRLLLSLDVLAGVPLVRGAFEIEGFPPLYNPVLDVAGLLRAGVRL